MFCLRALFRVVAMVVLLSGAWLNAQDTSHNQPYRPQVHYSPQHNWTNDPNGLIFFHGEYHLFYQYNPFGEEWGHMSWGHAVSKDLLHWQELPVAIPEEGNTMIFTGSVVIDYGNTSGFCAARAGCLVAVYTGHTQVGHEQVRQTQNLAWSHDNGRTWTKYPGNPVLDLHMADFRDPSVSWNERAHSWLMAVALPKEHKVRFYSSPNLKQWTPLSDFGPQGSAAGDWECPDLLHVPAADGKGPGSWALKVGLNPGALQGGSGEQYFLGDFDGKQFTASTTPGAHGWTNYGKDDYCAISFNGLPAGQKPVLLGWMNNWQYASKLPTSPWRGQFSLPRRLSLVTDAAGKSLRQQPVVDGLHNRRVNVNTAAGGNKTSDSFALEAAPFELAITFAHAPKKSETIRLRSDDTHWTDIGFDGQRHTFYIDRTHAGLEVAPDFPGRVDAPVVPNRPFDIHLILDRSSVEAFAQNGTIAITDLILPPSHQTAIEFRSEDNAPVPVHGELWTLQSIWSPEVTH